MELPHHPTRARCEVWRFGARESSLSALLRLRHRRRLPKGGRLDSLFRMRKALPQQPPMPKPQTVLAQGCRIPEPRGWPSPLRTQKVFKYAALPHNRSLQQHRPNATEFISAVPKFICVINTLYSPSVDRSIFTSKPLSKTCT